MIEGFFFGHYPISNVFVQLGETFCNLLSNLFFGLVPLFALVCIRFSLKNIKHQIASQKRQTCCNYMITSTLVRRSQVLQSTSDDDCVNADAFL